MIVREIRLVDFMSHAERTVALPERGVVLVTGANGAGKSALIEAVSFAMWGRTIRGSSPWRSAAGSVYVRTADLAVTRTAAPKRCLEWTKDGVPPAAFDTTTRAQDALEQYLPAWAVWRQTCIFTSEDAASFTRATDGDRKRLIEAMLGLERFDHAATCASRDRDVAVRERDTAAHSIAVLDAADAAVKQRIGALKARLAQLPDVPTHDASRLVPLNTLVTRLNQRIAELTHAHRMDTVARAQLEAAAAEAERAFARVDRGECSACGQAISAQIREQQRGRVAQANAALASAADSSAEDLADELDEARANLTDVLARIARVDSEPRHAEFVAKQRSSLQAELAQVKQQVLAESDKRGEEARRLAAAASTLRVLDAVAGVLSLKGVRARMLDGALQSLEVVVNSWLARIVGEGVWVELRSHSERADGKGVKNAIALEVHGMGGGGGYRACSTGQRRRIDVAILMALADLAALAHGMAAPGGTLFVDECFDSLDADGTRAVADVVKAFAESRCVVVISHREDLPPMLDHAVHVAL